MRPGYAGTAENSLLALADAAYVSLRHRDHKSQALEIFDLDNRLRAGLSRSRAHQSAGMKVAQRDHTVKGSADHEIGLKLRYAPQRVLRGPNVVCGCLYLRAISGGGLFGN